MLMLIELLTHLMRFSQGLVKSIFQSVKDLDPNDHLQEALIANG